MAHTEPDTSSAVLGRLRRGISHWRAPAMGAARFTTKGSVRCKAHQWPPLHSDCDGSRASLGDVAVAATTRDVRVWVDGTVTMPPHRCAGAKPMPLPSGFVRTKKCSEPIDVARHRLGSDGLPHIGSPAENLPRLLMRRTIAPVPSKCEEPTPLKPFPPHEIRRDLRGAC